MSGYLNLSVSNTIGDKYVRSTRFEIISSGTSGTVTLPTNSTVVLDDFGGTTDAVIAETSSSIPTLVAARTASGEVVATTFDSSGNWSLTGTPSSYPVAILFRVRQRFTDFDSTASNIWGNSNVEYDDNFLHPSDGIRIIENWAASTAAGNNAWLALNNSGSVGLNASIGSTTRFGIFRCETLTSATAAPTLILGSGATFVMGGVKHSFETDVYIGALATVTEDFVIRIGYSNSTSSSAPTNGVFFEYDRATSGDFWRIRCTQLATSSVTVTAAAVTTGWNTFHVYVNEDGTLAKFFLNGVKIGEVATNIPNGTSQTVSPSYQIIKTAGTTTRLIYGDWAIIESGVAARDPEA